MDLAEPFSAVLAPLGLTLYDVEFAKGTLAVTISSPTGVDLAALTAANHALSDWLDEHDPIASRYTLDVASPGLERRLRTPEHFAQAVGERVTLRETRESEPTRRLEGELLSATATTATLRDDALGELTVELARVERSRTVFAWGEHGAPSPSRGRANAGGSR